MFLIRSLIGKIVLAAVVLLVAAGAGWYFFIREDNHAQKEAAPVTEAVLKAATAQASAAAAASGTQSAGSSATVQADTAAGGTSSVGARSYRIIEGQSTAWYLAPEKLASLPTSSVAKGTTKGVSGEFHLNDAGLDPAKPTKFTVDLKGLQSDRSQRDRRVQDALETSKFPTATFTATELAGMPKEFTTTDTVMQLTGTFDLHGVQKEVTWELKAKQDQGILSGLATIKFKYTDFNITKPDIGGFVSVEDEVTIQVQIFATPG
jgi:polyisoprenoid-binding protein YceI